MPEMLRSDREALAKLVRQRATLSKKMAEQRAAELLADAEAELAREFREDDQVWRELTATAHAAVRKADAELAKRCRELKIREEFRPELSLHWYGRGVNASRERRGELRKVAQARIEAMKRDAFVQIEAAALEAQTMLTRDGLESAAAHAFLDKMPTVEVLMPKLDTLQLTTAAAYSQPDDFENDFENNFEN